MISRFQCNCNSASYPSLLGLSLLCTTATALALGNCIILNPPSHCAASAARIVDLSVEAGMPSGVLQVVHGDASIFNGLSEHPDIAAVIFAGASVPAEAVYKRCTAANKRVVAFGGAKNHVFALPECHVTATARDVTTAFTAHAGQRRLAASVLVLVGDGSEQVKRAFLDTLVPEIVSLAGKLEAGQKPGQMGPLADAAARDRLVLRSAPLPLHLSHHRWFVHCRVLAYITEAEANGAKILLDGRRWATERPTANYVGPTVILHASATDRALKEEIFGPVLSVYCANSWEEAVAIEHSCAYGVASSVYTEKGSHAEWFVQRFRAALVGVNDCFVPSRGSLSFKFVILHLISNAMVAYDRCRAAVHRGYRGHPQQVRRALHQRPRRGGFLLHAQARGLPLDCAHYASRLRLAHPQRLLPAQAIRLQLAYFCAQRHAALPAHRSYDAADDPSQQLCEFGWLDHCNLRLWRLPRELRHDGHFVRHRRRSQRGQSLRPAALAVVDENSRVSRNCGHLSLRLS
jgi:hypothetical protein